MIIPRINLVNATFELLNTAIEDPPAFGRLLGATIADDWAGFPEALPAVRALYAENPGENPWGTLFFVEESPRALVGWGGYKGRPSPDGVVEIGYAIAPACRGRGLATEAVAQMVRRAFADPAINAVDAHTLGHVDPSTRVLEKAGFQQIGEKQDPEDGALWHWRYRRLDAERVDPDKK